MTFEAWANTLDRWLGGNISAAELEDWQSSALPSVVAHVQQGSAFYSSRLKTVDAAQLSLRNIGSLPFTTKDDLRDAMFDMLCGDLGDADFYFETTGTTGRPTPCPKAKIDFDLNYLPVAHALKAIVNEQFTDGEKPILAVLVPNDVHAACTTLSFAAKHAGVAKLDLFPISPTIGFERFFEVLLELRVNMLLCSPGLLMALAEMSESYGVDVRSDLNIRCLLTTGEVCSSSMKMLLTETWGADAYNFLYGSQEAGVAAVTTPSGAVVAVEPLYLFEVLDLVTAESLGFAGHGELCLTTLVPGIKPLIRYRTGDLVTVAYDQKHNRRTVDVQGRVKDMVYVCGQNRSACEIENAILADPTQIYGYELDVRSGDTGDYFKVRVKAKEEADHSALKALVADSVNSVLGVHAEVEVHPLLDMKSSTGGWVSWKTARIRDLRKPIRLDIEQRWAANLARAAAERI